MVWRLTPLTYQTAAEPPHQFIRGAPWQRSHGLSPGLWPPAPHAGPRPGPYFGEIRRSRNFFGPIGGRICSITIAIVISSGTNKPWFMYSMAFKPRGVPFC